VNWTYDGIYRLTNEAVTLDPHSKNGLVAYAENDENVLDLLCRFLYLVLIFLCGTSIPIAWLGLLEIQSIDEHGQFLCSHRYAACVLSGGPSKSAFLQTLGAHPQPAAIPYQRFQSRPRAVRE